MALRLKIIFGLAAAAITPGLLCPQPAWTAVVDKPLVAAERADLSAGAKKLVLTGLQNSADDFSDLRGRVVNDDTVAVNEAFGTVLRDCVITGSNTEGYFVLACSTPMRSDPKRETLELIRSAIADTLPTDFVQKVKADVDYTWESGAADIQIGHETSGHDTSYTVYIFHFD